MNEKPKILIIEDDIDLTESIKKLLETKGYNVIIAYDPEEGNTKLKQEGPDIIILDVMFGTRGETKGFDFARKIKNDKLYAGIPVVMMSAINTKEPFFNFSPETDGEYLPVECFLDKPIQPDDLFSKIENLLQRKTNY